jgi:crotonobetaine/carnitine-CoA ligase
MSTAPARPAPPWAATVAARLRAIEAAPMPANIGTLMDDAVAEVPNRIALHFIASGEELSYAALLQTVNRTSNGLRAAGITHGTRVAVMLPNLPAMPITWLALARIGAVMVPVNTRYTGHELEYVLGDSGAAALVIHSDFLAAHGASAAAARLAGSVFVVGGEPGRLRTWSELQAGQPESFAADVEPALDDLMNIQYTSGTTGMPKGCMLSQHYWLTCARSYSDSDGLRFRHILAGNPFFYMTPQWLTLMAFFQRGTLHVGPHRSLTRYMDWIRDYGIEFCLFPSNIHDTQPPHPLDSATRMRRGNLYLHHPERHAEMQRRFGFPLRTAFGMTEIGMGLSMPLEAEEMTGSGSCGIAGPFREVRIADDQGRTMPAGKAGELLIRGPGILQGYWNKPEATAAAFHGDWFRTGDLAWQDEHGFVWIVGRLKDMVRRAGENIAAAEVEAAIASLPGIQEAAVIPVPDDLRGEEVKAYIRLKPGVTQAQVSPEAIIAHCRDRLASFKVPRYIEYRSTPFPLSAAGSKVDKPALRAERPDLIADAWDRLKQER